MGNTLSTSQRLDIGLIAAKVLYDVSRDSYADDATFNDEDISGFLVARDSDCALNSYNGVVYSSRVDTSTTTNDYMSTFLVARHVRDRDKESVYFVPKHCNTPFEDADATIYVNDQPTVKFQLPEITAHNPPWHDDYHGKQDNLESRANIAKSGMLPGFIKAFGSQSQYINTKCRDYLSRPKTTPSPPKTSAPTTLSNFASTADPTTAYYCLLLQTTLLLL